MRAWLRFESHGKGAQPVAQNTHVGCRYCSRCRPIRYSSSQPATSAGAGGSVAGAGTSGGSAGGGAGRYSSSVCPPACTRRVRSCGRQPGGSGARRSSGAPGPSAAVSSNSSCCCACCACWPPSSLAEPLPELLPPGPHSRVTRAAGCCEVKCTPRVASPPSTVKRSAPARVACWAGPISRSGYLRGAGEGHGVWGRMGWACLERRHQRCCPAAQASLLTLHSPLCSAWPPTCRGPATHQYCEKALSSPGARNEKSGWLSGGSGGEVEKRSEERGSEAEV